MPNDHRAAAPPDRPVSARPAPAPDERPAADTQEAAGVKTLRLPWQQPYDAAGMLHFFETHQVTGMDVMLSDPDLPGRRWLTRSLAIGPAAGWLQIAFDSAAGQALLRFGDGLAPALPALLRRVRALLDLDADPAAIDAVLLPHFPGTAGGRVPGCLDGFELAVRAILGQQVTVAAAHTLCGRLVARFGAPVDTPFPQVTRLFPTPAALAQADSDTLGGLGIVRQRQAAIVALAREVLAGRLGLQPGDAPEPAMAALRALPGIGDWTAQYVALRALRWDDAFPAGDVALQKALGVRGTARPALAATQASEAWRPWRSYAVLRAWHGRPEATMPPADPATTRETIP